MRNSHSDSAKNETRLRVAELETLAQEWLLDNQLRQHSAQTIYCRKDYLKKLFWFLESRGFEEVGALELKGFLLYLSEGHKDPGGRWNNPRLTQPMRPVSIHAYYRVLRALFNWLIEDEAIEFNPMQRIKPPVVRTEVKQPLPEESLHALLKASKASQNPQRNEAIIRMLVDTGLRRAELCSLKTQDVDFTARSLRVLGKGNKFRMCYLSPATVRVLSKHLRKDPRQPNEPLFISERDSETAEPLTASGVFQLLRRLGKAAGIAPGQCTPHALRRFFAVGALRNGASVFAVQNLLGHTDLEQSRLYCAIAQADIQNQHRQFSPGSRLKS